MLVIKRYFSKALISNSQNAPSATIIAEQKSCSSRWNRS